MDDLATLEPDALADELGPSTPTQRSRWSGIRRVHSDAGMLVVKHARSDGRAGLRREAEVLDAVGGSMLVRFVELRDLPDTTELVLRDTGGPSLASMLRDPATKPVDALTHLAETCETVARLHAAGWSHGRLGPDHVLMSARGRIRLCSLRAAMPIDVDPTVARDDRAALLRMVDDWVASASTHGSARRPASRVAAGRVARCTRRLADAPDPIVLARILRRCSRPLGPRPRVAAAVAAIAAATVGISLLAVTRSPPSSAERATTARATTRPATTRPATTRTATTRPATRPTTTPEASAGRSSPTPVTTAPPSNDAPSPAACADPGSPSDSAALAAAVDVDGDGCAEVVSTQGNNVTVGSRRFRIGSESDVVAVGDWDCDGRSTPAVLDPISGAVHVFDRWATADTPSTARLLGRVHGGATIAAPLGRCGPLVVTRTDGTSTAMEPG